MIELEGFIVREGLMIILGDVKLLSVYILIFNCDSPSVPNGLTGSQGRIVEVYAERGGTDPGPVSVTLGWHRGISEIEGQKYRWQVQL